jgi:molybdopterin synthase catalytic subunit
MIFHGRARSSKDRAAAFEAVRWEFESLRAYTPFFIKKNIFASMR